MISEDLKKRFEEEIQTHPVVIYMKGNALFPRCGFSAAAYQLLSQHGPVHAVDVLSDSTLRDGIKEYSSWPTIPQIYIRGQFVGGSDIVRDLAEKGELAKLIQG